MTKDPVCGMEVDEEHAMKEVYEGRTYYFCSEQCLSDFKNNPQKFVK